MKITPEIIKTVPGYTQTALAGHIGTHFDVMNKEFPLEFTRRGKEHTPKDQHCADRSTFVVENLTALHTVIENGGHFTAHTYPMNDEGITGLPCRVVAEVCLAKETAGLSSFIIINSIKNALPDL